MEELENTSGSGDASEQTATQKYLDLAGLAILWSRIKAVFVAQSNLRAMTDAEVDVSIAQLTQQQQSGS